MKVLKIRGKCRTGIENVHVFCLITCYSVIDLTLFCPDSLGGNARTVMVANIVSTNNRTVIF